MHKNPQGSRGVALRHLLHPRHFLVIICYASKIHMNFTFYYTKYSCWFNVKIKFLPHIFYPQFSTKSNGLGGAPGWLNPLSV